MKSEVKERPAKPIKFPCLMRDRRDGAIVLFSKEGRGAVVGDGAQDKAGVIRDSWTMDYFEPFEGTITLSKD